MPITLVGDLLGMGDRRRERGCEAVALSRFIPDAIFEKGSDLTPFLEERCHPFAKATLFHFHWT